MSELTREIFKQVRAVAREHADWTIPAPWLIRNNSKRRRMIKLLRWQRRETARQLAALEERK